MSFTYTTLKTAVLAAAEDQSTEFDSYFDTGLRLAQLRMTRELDTFGIVRHARTSVSAGDPFLTKPENCRVVKSLIVFSSVGTQTALMLVTDEFIQDYWPIRTSVGTPKYYSKWDDNSFILAPTPDSAQDIEMSYVVLPTLASATHTTNWYTDEAGDALFYATMVEMSFFSKNNSAVDKWELRYQGAMNGLRNEARRTRREDQREPAASQGENNLIEGTR